MAKFGFVTTPVPIPRFEGKENCTFTVRVPRYFLSPFQREQICARRALWGSGIYTDDSDPLAAAIHAGYVRGDWGDDASLKLLELTERDKKVTLSPPTLTGSDIPEEPPPQKDLHVTLLILPPLEKYGSAVLHGLKSRKWGGNHDGMSFKVHKIEYVDEGSRRGEERGGEARRKRLKAMMGEPRGGGSLAPAMKLKNKSMMHGNRMEGITA